MNRPPETLKESFDGLPSQREFGYAIRDFVDRFREDPDPGRLADEPDRLTGRLQDGGLADAWLAAAAAWLARRHGLPVPRWAQGSARALDTPWFAAETHKLRMLLLQDSPTEFRIRNLFVSADVLERV